MKGKQILVIFEEGKQKSQTLFSLIYLIFWYFIFIPMNQYGARGRKVVRKGRKVVRWDRKVDDAGQARLKEFFQGGGK